MKLNSTILAIILSLSICASTIRANSTAQFVKKNLIAKPIICLSLCQLAYGCKTLKEYNASNSQVYCIKKPTEYFSYCLSTAFWDI